MTGMSREVPFEYRGFSTRVSAWVYSSCGAPYILPRGCSLTCGGGAWVCVCMGGRYRGAMRSEGVKELTGRDWDKTTLASDTRMATSQLRMLTAEYKPMVELTWSQVRLNQLHMKAVARPITVLVTGGTIYRWCDIEIDCGFPPLLHHNISKSSHPLRGR